MEKIKVCLICHLSSKEIHSHLPLRLDFGSVLLKLKGHQPLTTNVDDFAVWNIKAISELEKCSDKIELHVIAPYAYLKPKTFECQIKSTYFHFFRNDDEALFRIVFRRYFKIFPRYRKNRKLISDFIARINPDIIHIIGAENPSYATCVYDIPQNIPTIVQLQTLMNDPEFKNNYKIREDVFDFRSKYELEVMRMSSFIGTAAEKFINIIKGSLLPDKIILNTTLPLTEPIDLSVGRKEFDFVYFAADISKSADWAIEAFILASKKNPGITLDIVGGYSIDYRHQLETRLKELELLQYVTFEGKLETHEDVIHQVRKSRFAILPMKIDLLTGTVRECMANGIPTVTTITPSSPKMNEKRQSLLLSDKGDFQSMADNMCRLLEDEQLAETIRQNAGLTASERSGNSEIILHWVEAYRAIIGNKRNGTSIPDNFCAN